MTQPTSSLHILIACGGTGGHLFPGIAVAEALRARGHRVKLLISRKQVDADASAKYSHLDFEALPAVAKPPTLSPRMIPFLWKTWQSIRQCKAILKSFRADAVIGMGGFTSLPPIVAGRQLGLKTFVHDSNARPGRANVLTSRWCSRVFLGFEAAARFFPHCPTEVTGTPVRPEILNRPSREDAAAHFGLNPNQATVLVTGGSQGARRLNDIVCEAVGLLAEGTQVLHVTGAIDHRRITDNAGKHRGHHIVDFCNDMAAAYAACDLVVTRSGASSLVEIAHASLPSILVPYPFAADDHQSRNAEVFATAGAARMIAETDLNGVRLAEMIRSIIDDLPSAQGMAKAAGELAIPNAATRVCHAIESTLTPA